MRVSDGDAGRRFGASRRWTRALSLGALFGLQFLAGSSAYPQTARSGGDNARAMQQMQQLASERTALQAENSQLKDQVADLKKKLDQATAGGSAALAQAKALQGKSAQELASKQQLTESLEKTRGQMQELITRFRETAQNLKTVEIERGDLRNQVETRGREYAVCVDHNVDLYQLNLDTLNRLQKRGFWSAARDEEPFTQISRARLENLIDAYRYRIDELRVERQKKTVPGNSPSS